ncbi:IclR family transcriptional regulator [Desulfatitalea alkaliphila]|uniref:IclR family transcriptional regulator n=1 Tax=Desulfatitalea alkaliphila TaxID=2929485 RepID=A0AA41R5I7_9BACT|nr:IclR family transcriptional regulator [Desulfatitalea alkaliphila]MCJ8501236.1 IclR family transcriptional regulator [Desulfatitalea alkaliphila]
MMAIQSVDRALQILNLFSHRVPVLGVTEISRAVGLSKGTVHGLIRTLLQQGFLQQDSATRKYRLGLKIYELGIIWAGTLEINQKSAGPMNQLAKETLLECRLAIWDGDSMVITSTVHPRARAVLPHQFGPRVHAYCSAIGKAVLAFMDDAQVERYLKRTQFTAFTPNTVTDRQQLLEDLVQTRQRGYAFDREEAVQGLSCIGAPIYQRSGQVAGALSVSGGTQRVMGDKMEGFALALMNTAAEISRYMGYFPGYGDTAAADRPR